MKQLEFIEQQKVVAWAYENQERFPALRWLFHPANGGKRDIKTAVRMRNLGVKAGVSDLILLFPVGYYHGLIIEMKVGKGKLSAFQERFLIWHAERGYFCRVCYGADHAIKTIKEYFEL